MAENEKSFSDMLKEIEDMNNTGIVPEVKKTIPKIKVESEVNGGGADIDDEFNDMFSGLSLDSFNIDNNANSEDNKLESEKEVQKEIEETKKSSSFILEELPPIEDSIKKDVINDSEKTEVSVASKDNPVVTPDGRTLEEMLIGMRSGATKLDDKLSQYKKGLKRTSINGKEKEDDRYTKHADVIEKETERNEARKKASKKFVQKNSRYTEEEKVIMKSLGLNPDEFTTMLSKKSGLTDADKAKLLNAGRLGTERYFKGKRFRATVGDLDIIQFLAKFKFCNTKILSRLRDEPQSRTWRKLSRLKEGGLVADSEVISMGTIWYLTEAGMALSGYSFPTMRTRFPKTSTMPPVIGANHVAACLWNNSFNVLMLDDYPAYNKLVEKSGELTYVKGENLISELEIRSSLGKEAQPSFGAKPNNTKGNMYDVVGERARAMWHEWEVRGKDRNSPEFEIGNEFLWVLYPESGLTKSYHVPDLILSRQRAEDGTPRSIAVEVELNPKSDERYVQILMAYKLDTYLYDKVVWVTNSTSITRKLIKIAEEIGLENFDVVPMTNENGIYKNRDIWHI